MEVGRPGIWEMDDIWDITGEVSVATAEPPDGWTGARGETSLVGLGVAIVAVAGVERAGNALGVAIVAVAGVERAGNDAADARTEAELSPPSAAKRKKAGKINRTGSKRNNLTLTCPNFIGSPQQKLVTK